MHSQGVLEAIHVEAELLRVGHQVLRAKRVLMLEEQVVHVPEPTLLVRRLGGLGGDLSAGMNVGQRQVAPDVGDVAVVGEQLADHRLRLSAVRALEVAVFHERHRRLLRPADVIDLRIDRDREVHDCLGRTEHRPYPQSPRKRRRSRYARAPAS